MKNNMKKDSIVPIFLLAILLLSCEGMNENVDKYLEKGETIYIAKSDSAYVYSGLERFVLKFWISDPRAIEMRVKSTFLEQESVIEIPIGHDILQPIEASIPAKEGNITLFLVTNDAYGNTSIKDEYIVNVYGDDYRATVSPKFVHSAVYDNKKTRATITWGEVASEKEYGVKVFYTTLDGEQVEKIILTKELKSPTVIENMDINHSFYYQTISLPEETCVDLVYTEKAEIKF